METLTTAVDVRYPYFLESAKWQLCTKYMFEDDGWLDRKAITIQKYVSDFVEKNIMLFLCHHEDIVEIIRQKARPV